jgi:hypothetical protein
VVPVGVPVIFYNENSPRPSLPYVTLYLQSLVQIGSDYTAPPDNTGDAEMVGDREFTLQFQSYGGDPITLLENVRTSLQKQTVLDTLRANGIVFVNHFPINDITALLDTEFEARASMDILFRIAQTDEDVSGNIETVEIEETLNDSLGVVYNETVTIPAP